MAAPGHLIHIGYPKAGTTYLQHWFASHPQLGFRWESIAGFRNVYDIAREGASLGCTIRYRVTSSETFSTPHATAGTSLPAAGHALPKAQAEVCATLRALFPNAWILLVTRGFRSALLSGYSQYVRDGGQRGFCAPPVGPPHPDHGHARNYDHLIDLYSAAFGDRLIVMPFELLRDDEAAFLRELERRLGLDRFDYRRAPMNASLSTAELLWYPRLARAVNRLPIGATIRRPLLRLQARAAMGNWLRLPISWLDAVSPAGPLAPDIAIDHVVEDHRGRAERLRHHPLYAPYHKDYLL